jgi:hypothetical protein
MPVNGARERERPIARGVPAGDIQALEGAIALCPLFHLEPTIASKNDANLKITLASEIDTIPIRRAREEWHPDFLPEKDAA